MALYYRLLFPNQAFRQLEDIEQLIPFMYLSNAPNVVVSNSATTIKCDLDSTIQNTTPPPPPNTILKNQPIKHLIDPTPIETPLPSPSPPKQQIQSAIYPKQPDSLFWCIYIARHGYQAYTEIGHRYGNTEIDEKQRIMELMRASPNKIKDCPKRITKAQYQEIMSDFMTNKRVNDAMLTVFAIYCNMRIWVVNMGKSGAPESWYMDIHGNDGFDLEPIIIYRKTHNQYGIELTEGEPLTELVSNIKSSLFRFDNFDAPLKAISNYKTADLEDIADHIGISLEGKCKKQDIYNKIIQFVNK